MNVFERFGLTAGNRKLSSVELETFASNVSRMMSARQKTAETDIRFGETNGKATGKRDSPLIPPDLARHV